MKPVAMPLCSIATSKKLKIEKSHDRINTSICMDTMLRTESNRKNKTRT